jgi:hypothetical protein
VWVAASGAAATMMLSRTFGIADPRRRLRVLALDPVQRQLALMLARPCQHAALPGRWQRSPDYVKSADRDQDFPTADDRMEMRRGVIVVKHLDFYPVDDGYSRHQNPLRGYIRRDIICRYRGK